MEVLAKKFARKIMVIHLLLLAGVIFLVLVASREVYLTTRDQTIDEAKKRQELLAAQTADGIASFYDSIRSDMDLMRHVEGEETSSTTPAGGATHAQTPEPSGAVPAAASAGPAAPAGPALTPRPSPSDAAVANLVRGRLTEMVGAILWRQLSGRASQVFILEREHPPIVGAERLKPRDRERELLRQPLGSATIKPVGPPDSLAAAEEIVERMRPWLKSVDKPSISDLENFKEGVPANLVCVPAGPAQRQLMIAVVPIHEVAHRFLEKLGKDSANSVALVDADMKSLFTGDQSMASVKFIRAHPPATQPAATSSASEPVVNGKTSITLDHPVRIGEVDVTPRIITVQSFNVMGARWSVLVSSSLADVDAVVNRMFRRAVWWGLFVIVSMTAILVSTAVQMIRSRVRLERIHHEMLSAELTQARQIQLAWLPDQALVMPSVDLAAINTPANHISGDFYNWFELPADSPGFSTPSSRRIVITIGDVTGHGMSAAFLMATTQLLVRVTMTRVGDPGRCLQEVNSQLCTQIFSGQFVTMLVVVVDVGRHELQIASAGHYPPLLSDGESFQPIKMDTQLVLGIQPDEIYTTEHFPLPPHASLLLYTDGLLDVLAPQGGRFGSDGLKRGLYGRFENARAMIDTLLESVNRFRGPRDLPDDLTLVAMQLGGTPSDAEQIAVGATAD